MLCEPLPYELYLVRVRSTGSPMPWGLKLGEFRLDFGVDLAGNQYERADPWKGGKEGVVNQDSEWLMTYVSQRGRNSDALRDGE